MTLNVGYAVSSLILLGFFLVTLFIQLGVSKYHPVIYWLVIVSTSTAGTTMSDYMDRSLGLGYTAGTLILISGLIIILAIWRYSQGTLSVNVNCDTDYSPLAKTPHWQSYLVVDRVRDTACTSYKVGYQF